jgi:hypothetical protein
VRAINIQGLLQQPGYPKSDIQFCNKEPAYWLSLFQKGAPYSTTGQCSYGEAYKHALLWISIKRNERCYKILHEVDGFQVEETPSIISQKCQQSECHFVSNHSKYSVDACFLRSERLNHLARHNGTGQRNIRILFICVLFVLAITVLGIYRGWL